MRINQNAIITILLSGFTICADVAVQWFDTEWIEPSREEGWSEPQEFKPSGSRRLQLRLNDDQDCLDVYYDTKSRINFFNMGWTRLEYHARDELKSRWLQGTLNPDDNHWVIGGEAKVWFKRAQE